jgi:16S rRNA (adenine1518-N6/adenine1519-N6)-dimethyltransferase
VESAVLRLTPCAEPSVAPADAARYRALVQEAFGLRRKQMRRVLRTIANLGAEAADAVLQRAGIDPGARPETLSPEDFARVMEQLREVRSA